MNKCLLSRMRALLGSCIKNGQPRKSLWILCMATFVIVFYLCFQESKPILPSFASEVAKKVPPETVRDWVPMHIMHARYSRLEESKPLSSKIIGGLYQFRERLGKVFPVVRVNPDISHLTVTESFACGVPPANYGSSCTMITDDDIDVVIKKYGENPFLFDRTHKINEEKTIQKLIKEGYHPQRGVYDSISKNVDIEGFSFSLKDSATGYAISVQKGKIVQIRKLRNYSQYLEAREKKTDYTAQDISMFYLPEFKRAKSSTLEEKDMNSLSDESTLAMEKWSPAQITYAYVSKNSKMQSETIDARNAILKQSFQEAYLELAANKRNYLSVSQQDVKSIVETYGENPFRLRFKDNIDEVATFQKLKKAGYQPRIMQKNLGFSFPLKNDSGGYSVYIDNGRISKIRELWNYAQFLECEKKTYTPPQYRSRNKSDEYTAHGVLLLYLPDLEKKD